MRKNVASQVVAFQMVSATDGSAVTTGTPTVYYTVDGGTQGTGAGTSTHEGNGQWSYVPAQAETNGNHVAFTMVLTNAISQCVNVYPVAYDETSASLGLNDPTAAAIADAVWDEARSGHTTAGTFGEGVLVEDLNSTAETAVAAQVGVGLAVYDPPTKTELDAGFAALNDPTAAAIADAVWDEAQSGHTTAGTFGKYLDTEVSGVSGGGGGTSPQVLQSTTIATLASQTSFTLTAGSADDNAYNNRMAVITDSVTSTQKAVGYISDYVGSTKTVTLKSDPGIFTMAAGDTIDIIAVGADLPSISTRFDTVDSAVTTVDTVVDGIKAVTDNLPDSGALTTIASNLSAVLADTGTDGVVISTATAQAIADEILSRSVSNVEATTAEHTLATIVLAILESARSSTTWTIKRTDGSTTHATKTLTLDSTASPVVGVE